MIKDCQQTSGNALKLSIEPSHHASIVNHNSLPVHETVYMALCDAILRGKFVPGVSVTLRGLAKQLGVSPMPVREAIRRLVAEGALEVLSNRRVSVAPMNKIRLDELLHARLSLEPSLAVAALCNMSVENVTLLSSIDKSINHCILQGNIEDYIYLNQQFHFGIYKYAYSPVLMPLVKSLWLQFAPFSRIVFGRVGTKDLNDYHADALIGILNKDEVAVSAAISSDITEGMSILDNQLSSIGIS